MAQPTYPDELVQLRIELESEEVVLEIIHKHWGKVMWPLIMLSTAIFITLAILIIVLTGGFLQPLTTVIVLIISLFWEASLVAYAFSEWIGYKRSAIVLTNQRLIDCQQINFLSRRLQVVDIHEIQSCTGEAAPLWGVFLDYGDLWVNTVGDKPIDISFVPSPEKVAGLVMHHHNLIAHGRLDLSHIEGKADPLHDEPLPPAELTIEKDPLAEPAIANEPLTLVMFHIPREKLNAIRDQIPAQKEPSVIYLAKTNYFEVETIIPTSKVKSTVAFLKEHGAEDIVGGPVLNTIL